MIPFFNKESQEVRVEHTEKITQAVTCTERRMQPTEIENLMEQERDTANDVTRRVKSWIWEMRIQTAEWGRRIRNVLNLRWTNQGRIQDFF